MAKTPQITDAEWQVMKVLWGRAPLTAAEVCALLDEETDWKPSTVKTLLGRLVEKQAVRYEPRGREYLYSPEITEGEAVRSAAGTFVQRVFGGAVAPMLAHFVEEHRLSDAEIVKLRAMLDAARAKADRKGKKQ